MRKDKIYFNDETTLNKRELNHLVKTLIPYVVEALHLKNDIVVSITITDDENIHQINRDYRGVDSPTDVISFAYSDAPEDMGIKLVDLGEIVISLDTAKKQALTYAHPVEREITFLLIHGFLHLCGYDHMQEEDAEKMFALQNDLLNNFKYEYKELK